MKYQSMWRVALAAIAATVMAVSSAHAQASGILRGTVSDPQGAAMPGVTVAVVSPSLQGPRETITDQTGGYAVLGLPPGTYEMTAAIAGFQKSVRPGLVVRAAQTITVNVQLQVGEVTESVTVAGRSASDIPIVDVTNPELHFNISGEFLNQLPLGSRQQWDQLWQLVPGVVTSARSGDGDIEPQIHGASERSNVMKLDNFDIGNAFTNQQWTTQFSTEIIQDVSIKTAGLDASTPLGRGGFLNIVTKSGGNSIRGSGAFFVQPRSWNDNNVPGGTTIDQSFYQPDASLGGPIVRDQLWYFASYRMAFVDEGVPRSAAVIQSFADNGFDVPQYDKTNRNNRFFGKVTHKATNNQTLTYTYLDDRGWTYNSDSRDQSTEESTIDIANGGPTAQVAWNAVLGSRLLLTAQYGYRRQSTDIVPGGGDSEPAYVRFLRTTTSSGVLAGQDPILYYGNRAGLAWWSTGVRDHHEFTADATYVVPDWGGEHTFQAGTQYKPRSRGHSDTNYPVGGPALIEEVRRVMPDGSVVYTPFHRRVQDPSRVTAFSNTYELLGFYVQDKWAPTDRLTVTLGARYDIQKTADTFDIWGIDTGSFNPRFGAAYSLGASNRDVIRVTWGRMNDLLYTQAAPSVGGAAAGQIDEYDLNLDGTFETVRTTPAVLLREQPEDRLLDDDLATPISDEFHVGYTRQLPGRVTFDAAYVHKIFRNEIGTIDTNIIYENNRFAGYRNPTYSAIPITTNLDASKEVYHAFEVSLIRNLGDNWQAFANYTYQKKTAEGEWREDQADRYLYPADWFENDQLARPHILRLNGSYMGPWGIMSSVIYSMTSGNVSAPVTTTLPAPDPQYGPPSMTLSNGRVVPNPLATTTRLVGPRGDNVLQTPTVHRLNLRFGKEFRITGTQTFDFNVDVFNVTNNGAPLFFRATNDTSPFFGQFLSTTQAPRAAQVSVVYRF